MASSSSSSSMTTAPRQEMITSAISFLQDPKVASSSVAQRIAFLESKGLSSGEIDEALRRSGVVGGGNGPPQQQYHQGQAQQYYGTQQQQQSGYYYPPPPPNQSQGRDWRDWFIMAVVSGTIGYGVIALARRYLFPHLQPPNQTILESDRDALTAKYDEVAATLSQLDSETRAVKAGLEQQKSAIDSELKLVEEALEQLRTGERSRKEEMERISREVESMKRDMPKMFESSSSSTATSLTELQSELKSLRSLLVSRTSSSANSGGGASGMTSSVSGPVNGSSGYSSPMRTGNGSPPLPVPPFGMGATNGGKPAIPAWQLAAGGGSGGGSAASSSSEKEKATEGAPKEQQPAPKENGAYDV